MGTTSGIVVFVAAKQNIHFGEVIELKNFLERVFYCILLPASSYQISTQ